MVGRKTAGILVLALFMSMQPMTAFAFGPGEGLSSSGGSGQYAQAGQGTGIAGKVDLSSLDTIRSTASFTLSGEGAVTAEPILGTHTIGTVYMKDRAGNTYSAAYSHDDSFAFSPGGFQSLMLDQNSVGRYYYRAYTNEHGWSPWATTREATPASDDARVTAIQIRSKGYHHNLYELYYKVVLNDGTETDWAPESQACGTIGGDRFIVAIKLAHWKRGVAFPGSTGRRMIGGANEGLYYDEGGVPRYSLFSSMPYTGWGYDAESRCYFFQEGTALTGWQYLDGYKYYFDESGRLVKDLEPLMGLTGDYQIKINKATRTMYVMAKDGGNGYVIPYKTFMITAGPDTPLGSYRTYVKYRWKFMHEGVYCQYLSRFYKGFLMHSLIYSGPNSDLLNPETYNNMDFAKSSGCIRLKAEDAAWLYHNAPMGTSVVTYSDPWNKGPVEKDAIEQPIPLSQTYDPTDPLKVEQANAAAAAAAQEEARLAAAQAEAEMQRGLNELNS